MQKCPESELLQEAFHGTTKINVPSAKQQQYYSTAQHAKPQPPVQSICESHTAHVPGPSAFINGTFTNCLFVLNFGGPSQQLSIHTSSVSLIATSSCLKEAIDDIRLEQQN